MLRQAMINPDRLEIQIAAVAGAVLGIVTGILLKHEWLGIITWALLGAVVISGLVYCLRAFRRSCPPLAASRHHGLLKTRQPAL
jgi:hypothetical protein